MYCTAMDFTVDCAAHCMYSRSVRDKSKVILLRSTAEKFITIFLADSAEARTHTCIALARARGQPALVGALGSSRGIHFARSPHRKRLAEY